MIKCVGYQEKQGSFESIVYDNIHLFLISNDDPDVIGFSVSELKIKRSDWDRLVGSLTPSDLLDKEIELLYSLQKDKPKLKTIALSDSILY